MAAGANVVAVDILEVTGLAVLRAQVTIRDQLLDLVALGQYVLVR
jgi:hypothetical protein